MTLLFCGELDMKSTLGKSSHIVVLDDEPLVAQLAASAFSELGFENVNLFSRSEEYIQHMRQHTVDLCLLDINLNNADGLVLLGWSKAQQRQAKVVMFSGNTQKHLVEEAQLLGAEGFLSKIDLECNLRQLLNKWNINYPLT